MPVSKQKADPRELVHEKYPNAFVDDDGEWVWIYPGPTITTPCPTCKQDWTRVDDSLVNAIGSGNCESSAWESAAKNLKLM